MSHQMSSAVEAAVNTAITSAVEEKDALILRLGRTEVVKSVFKFALLTAVTYYGMKWLLLQFDPTQKQKRTARGKAEAQLKRLFEQTKKKDLLSKLSEYEIMIASQLVNPEDMKISWNDIAGLKETIEELHETVILPLQRRDLFSQSSLIQAPKGVLLYGPPGCGKTLIAKATARESQANFIHLDVSILTDKWYGESQKLASAVFSLAMKLQPCIVFIDEIDSLLRARGSHDHEATAMMKAQFMSLWDGLGTDPNCTVIVMGATNRPEDIDRAILRRMPATFHIRLPNVCQRQQILELILKKDRVSTDVLIKKISAETEGFSGSDLHELCRIAATIRLRNYLKTPASRNATVEGGSQDGDNQLPPIKMSNFVGALEKMKESKQSCSMSASLN